MKARSVDGPVEEVAKPCTVPEPLVAMVVEASGRSTTPAGHSAMVGKSQHCESRKDVEASVLVRIDVAALSGPHLKAIVGTR